MNQTEIDEILDDIEDNDEWAMNTMVLDVEQNCRRFLESVRKLALYESAYYKGMDEPAGFQCSNCGGEVFKVDQGTYWHYWCPDCGADSADSDSREVNENGN